MPGPVLDSTPSPVLFFEAPVAAEMAHNKRQKDDTRGGRRCRANRFGNLTQPLT